MPSPSKASAIARAPRELRGFEAVELAPGESRDVSFALTRRELSHWDGLWSRWAVEAGPLTVWVGESSRDLPLEATVELVAPARLVPLGAYSTVAEWLAHPEAGPAVLEALGAFGDTFTGGGEMAGLLAPMPLIKIAMMGMSKEFTVADIDGLVATYGA